MRRVLVTGSRDWPSRDAVASALLTERWIYGEFVLVHGDCPTGADLFAKEWAEALGVPHEPHPADWGKHGKAAGPIRNQEMVDLGADICLAFPLGPSRGTRGCMKMATKAGIPVQPFTIQGLKVKA